MVTSNVSQHTAREHPTLVLNRNWQPVNVATVARSLTLLWNDSARVVDPVDYRLYTWADWSELRPDEGERFIQAVRLRVPEVIVLAEYDRRRSRTRFDSWQGHLSTLKPDGMATACKAVLSGFDSHRRLCIAIHNLHGDNVWNFALGLGDMSMWYWRQSNYEGLAEVAAATAEMPELRNYSEYCQLREQGLRKQAFAALHEFINASATWDVARRREFVDWLLTLRHNHPEIYDLVPNPLRIRLVEPTVENWLVDEPLNAVPHRWLGTIEGYRNAIRLDQNEQIARELLIGAITGDVEYAVHEFPAGYLGNADDDEKALDEANRALEGLKNPEMRNQLLGEIAELSEKVDRYRQYISEHHHTPAGAGKRKSAAGTAPKRRSETRGAKASQRVTCRRQHKTVPCSVQIPLVRFLGNDKPTSMAMREPCSSSALG